MSKALASQRVPVYTLVILALLAAFILPSASAQDASEQALFVIKQNGLYGYMDKNGQVVITPRYLYAEDFSEGVAPVLSTDRDWLLINEKGATIKALQGIDAVRPFKDGLANYRAGAKQGFIDKSGKVVIPAEFDWASPFSEGLACVGYRQDISPQNRMGTFMYGYIDKKGKLVIALQFREAGSFSEGLAAVVLQTRGLWGYIDKSGKPVLEPQFYYAGAFSCGLAAVSRDGKYTGYVDKSGKWVLGPRYDVANRFNEGLAWVLVNRVVEKAPPYKVIEPGKWGVINTAGKMVLEPQFSAPLYFRNGLARIAEDEFADRFAADNGKTTKNRIGYIDKTGKFVWPMTN